MSWLFPGGTTIVGSPVTIGNTSVLPPGANATVTNTGTAYAPVLNFGIPTVANVEGTISGAVSTVVTKDLAPNIVVVTESSGKVANSSVTVTELGYLSGVTSGIQAQFAAKQATITGAASTVTTANLMPNVVVVTDASGKLSNNSITTTKLGYLTDVTSNIQAQLDAKQATIVGAAATVTRSNLASNIVVVTNAAGQVSNSSVTITELGYLSGVTSGVQSQINSKQATLTGAAATVTSANLASNIVVVTNAAGQLANNAISTTKLGYLADVTSNIQAQMDTKQLAYPQMVYVSSLSDLPASNAGVITLSNNTAYRFVSNVDLVGSRLVLGHNTGLVGTPLAATLRSTGIYTLSPLISASHDFSLQGMSFVAPTLLEAIVSNTALVFIRDCDFAANVYGATLGGGTMINMDSCTWNGAEGSGPVTIVNQTPLLYITNSRFKGYANTSSIQIASNVVTADRLYISACDFDSTTSTGITVSNVANLGSDGLWIDKCVFLSNTAVAGIDTTTSSSVYANGNKNLMNSRSTGVEYLTAPTTVLTANTATYYPLAGNYAAAATNLKFTANGGGKLIYTGTIPDKFMVSTTMSVLSTKKGDVCSFGIYDSSRGIVTPESVQTVITDTIAPINLTLFGVARLANTQYVEIQGKNATTPSGNIVVQQLTTTVVGS